MKKFVNRGSSFYFISVFIHVLFFLIFSFLSLGNSSDEVVYVEIGFGGIGTGSSKGDVIKQEENIEQPQPEKEKEEKIKAPQVKNDFDENIKTPDTKNKKKEEVKNPNQNVGDAPYSGFGGFGFDWGGRGTRKILRWEKPPFPPDVSKSIDIKIRFIILPDGSVVSPVPLIKADTRLEDAAMESIKTWRFEPLKLNQPQFEQIVIITIPFRVD